MEMMAAEHLGDIRKVQPHSPYFIGGACSGGVVAVEIAQQLHSLLDAPTLEQLARQIDRLCQDGG
jgi:surfactin synthase thioesterase subunit